MISFIKIVYYIFCFFLWKILRVFHRTPSVVVLMYHSISDDRGRLTVAPKVFARQMAYLRQKKNLVSLSDVVRHVKGEITLPDGTVAVSMDDGYLDTLTNAFPILEKYNIPATLFLTSDLSPLPALGNLARPTWNDVRKLISLGLVSIGLHGHEHKHLKSIADDRKALDQEFLISRDLIKKELGEYLVLYAYAFGERDPRVIPYLQSLGIEAGFGITDGIEKKGDNFFALRRVQIDRTMPFLLFRLRTTGAVSIASRIRHFLGR